MNKFCRINNLIAFFFGFEIKNKNNFHFKPTLIKNNFYLFFKKTQKMILNLK